jgi:hypothetical protein
MLSVIILYLSLYIFYVYVICPVETVDKLYILDIIDKFWNICC